jgi:hypothetical protein
MIVYGYLKFQKYDIGQWPLQFGDLGILSLEILGRFMGYWYFYFY